MKLFTYPIALSTLLAGSLPALAQHQHRDHAIEEIVVTSSQNKTRAQTALPVNILAGEKLRENAGATLGDTIKNTVGVHSSSFGAGVGQPVIRGLSGSRVSVLQNDLSTLDVSGASQDHASSVEALLAERIEILRGPATLLYGNHAVGGVVNVIDGRIAEVLPAATGGALELRSGSVDSGRAAVGKVDGALDQLAWHLDGLYRESGNYQIPGWAVDEVAVEALFHQDGDPVPAGELENSHGEVLNSSTEASQWTAGGSWIGERGFLGLAVTRLNNEYGLPPGAHGHDHSTDPLAAAEDVFVRLDMEQSRVEMNSGLELSGPVERIDLQLASNRYEHRELEGSDVGTVFENDGLEGRFTVNHQGPGSLSGVTGLQMTDRNFSATGEEAFIPPSDIRAAGLFTLQSFSSGAFTYELGARLNHQQIETRADCDSRESTWTASGAGIWNYREDSNLTLSLSRSQRAPTVEELYSNLDTATCRSQADPALRVMHAATARFELGNAQLRPETANNLELAWRKHLGRIRAEINLYYNRFDDFIYLSDVGEFQQALVSQYLQDDAIFKGFESQVLIPFAVLSGHLDLTLFADYVQAELATGEDLPRIAPGRAGLELAFTRDSWSARLRGTGVGKQDRVAAGEWPTDGYLRVDAYLDYHLPVGDEELLVFLKGSNLGDEEMRDHTSFLKLYAPAPGRSVELGLRYRF